MEYLEQLTSLQTSQLSDTTAESNLPIALGLGLSLLIILYNN